MNDCIKSYINGPFAVSKMLGSDLGQESSGYRQLPCGFRSTGETGGLCPEVNESRKAELEWRLVLARVIAGRKDLR